MMAIIPEEALGIPRKRAAITGVGTTGCRLEWLMVDFLASTGRLSELLATLALAKDGGDLERLHRAIETRLRRSHQKGLRPEHLEQYLSGLGREFLKDVGMSMEQLSSFAKDVYTAASWFSRVVNTAGGVEAYFKLLSNGGHIVPQLLLQESLAATMHRPPLVIAVMVRPHQTDTAAHAIFSEHLSVLLNQNLLHADLLVSWSNNQTSQYRSREELDRLAVAAMLAPIGARPRSSTTWLPAAEAYNALKRGRLVGIWAEKLDFKVHTRGRWPFRRNAKDRSVITTQALEALDAVMTNQRTSLTGLPAARAGQTILAVIGNIGKETFSVVELETQRFAPCYLVQAPFKHIYLARLANIDAVALRQELGIGAGHAASSPAANGKADIAWTLRTLTNRINGMEGRNGKERFSPERHPHTATGSNHAGRARRLRRIRRQ
jgi:hypothetical protein